MKLNERHSYQDYTGRDLTGTDPAEWEGTLVRGSCFCHEAPDARVFPDGISEIAFEACNLDNALLPKGAVVIECSTRRYQVQEDGEDWLVDAENKPIEPLHARFLLDKASRLAETHPTWATEKLAEVNATMDRAVEAGIIPAVKRDTLLAECCVAEIEAKLVSVEPMEVSR